MKHNLKVFHTLPFLICLGILLLNDFILKSIFHNSLTGKLSDFAGLYVFVIFWYAILPNRRQILSLITAGLFILWKSPFSQPFIDSFSQLLFPIERVIDFSDLIALMVIPVAYCLKARPLKITLSPLVLGCLSVFAFCATSLPVPVENFEFPQYLLFQKNVLDIKPDPDGESFKVYSLDSFEVVQIEMIQLEEAPIIDDDFHEASIARDLDLHFLRSLKRDYLPPTMTDSLSTYEPLRDSLIVSGWKKVLFPGEGYTDHLQFLNSRLEGKFERIADRGKILLEGFFHQGVKDSTWKSYDFNQGIVTEQYYRNHELFRTIRKQDSNVHSESRVLTRAGLIRNKKFLCAFLLFLVAAIVMLLRRNYKNAKAGPVIDSHFNQIFYSLTFPIPTYILYQVFESYCSVSTPMTWPLLDVLGRLILTVIILAPIFAFIFYVIKLWNSIDSLWYILLFSVLLILNSEVSFLMSL